MKKHLQKYIMFWVLLVVGLCSLFLFSNTVLHKQNARVVFLDVGQGDAILIIAASGRSILVDAGKYANISAKIARYMPISERSLDVLIATHPDIDHVAGFDTLLDEYDVDMFVHSGLLAGALVYRNVAEKVHGNQIQSHAAIAGEKIFIDENMYLDILSPYLGQKIDEPNDHSIVMRLVYEGKAVMLTGDASKLVEQNIVSMYGDSIQSDILKIGHHGSKTSTDDSFVKTVNPKYGIISASCDNSFGHPHASVLRTLGDNNVIELNTCDSGDIIFEFEDGGWVLEE